MGALREQLLAIRDKHGYLDPQIVVDEARNKSHPLHSRIFDLAPKDAAEAWYRHRAHELIQSIRIQYNSAADDHPRDVRAFVAVPRSESKQPVYEPVEEVMRDELARKVLLAQMEREWKALRARYGDMVEFGQMIQASLAEDAA